MPTIQIAVEISPLGTNGLVKLTAPGMSKFAVIGKTAREVLHDAPICLAELVNWAQMSDRQRDAILADAQGIETRSATTEGRGPKAANLHWQQEVRARTLRAAVKAMPLYLKANRGMSETEAFSCGIHGELMDIIEQLYGEDERAATVCSSDVAFEVMAALGFDAAIAMETGTATDSEAGVVAKP